MAEQDVTTAGQDNTTPGVGDAALATAPVQDSVLTGAEPKTEAEPATDEPAAGAEPEAETPEVISSLEGILPEGATVDEEVQAAFLETAKEMKLTADQATKLIGLQKQMLDKEAARVAAAYEARDSHWEKTFNEDPTYGGENRPQTEVKARRALATIDTDGSLTKYLGDTGQGNCTPLILALARFADSVSDDHLVSDKGGSGGAPKSQLFQPLSKY
jgi:hypothetical protein